jgi:hypothetical protein
MEQIVQGAFKDAGAELAKQFQAALGGVLGNLQVDIGRDKVVDATRESTSHLTRQR